MVLGKESLSSHWESILMNRLTKIKDLEPQLKKKKNRAAAIFYQGSLYVCVPICEEVEPRSRR
tara:strand:- start:310 stop:498 length:189 start_codon:yes stop_codon:yes gene_type:complete